MDETRRLRGYTAFLFSVLLIVSFLNIRVYAATDEKYDAVRYNVPSTKEWNINFNMELDKSTVNNTNILVYEKGSTWNIPVTVSLDSSLKKVSVKPSNPYTNEKTYVLEVTDRVKKRNINMSCRPYKLMFKVVDNVFAGLPAEEGLVVIDNTAYSAKYLANHKALVNEIITNGYYGVYYIHDIGYQNIKSLFNTDDFTGKTWIRHSNTMIYVDEKGIRHTYEWKYDKYEYQEILPAADVFVVSRSDIKLVSVKISYVYGVPDAAYFKVEHSNETKRIGDTVAFTTSAWGERVYFYSEDKTIVAKGYIYVGYDHTKRYMLTVEDSDGKGNTIANINNNGIAAMDDDGYIYYSNPMDKEKLYKMGFDGMFNSKISDDKAQYINISNGWIYYSNYSDGGKLYKVRTDGSGRTKILDDKSAYITISKNDIYYSNHSDGGKLYRIKKDGSDVRVSQSGVLSGNKFSDSKDEVAYLNIIGDWVYYSNYSDGKKPYLLNKEGIYKAKVADEWASCVQVEGNWIYYSSGSGVISKISKDGSGYIVPIRAKAKEFNKGHHINLVGDWIFYSNYEDGGKLYKVKADGSGDKIKLADEEVGYINVLGDFVYYTTTKGKMFRVPFDSNGNAKPEGIGAFKSSDKITLIEDLYVTIDYSDVNKSLSYLQDKYLPNKVAAIMGDNTMKQLVIAWERDPKKIQMKDGVYTHTGSVVGYNNTIKCYLMLPSEMLNDTNQIIINNNPGRKDTIEVIDKGAGRGVRLQEKDIISVYEDAECKRILGKGFVNREKKALISGLDFNPLGGNIYLTVQRVGKSQSKPTMVVIPDVPVIDSTSGYDGDNIGLGIDGRDFTLGRWTKSRFKDTGKFSPVKQYIYILPSRTQIDLMNNTPVDEVLVSYEGPWKGEKINPTTGKSQIIRDSRLNLFKSGNYDIYVALEYEGYGTYDVEGNSPIVTGKFSTEYPAGLNSIEEVIPDRIFISSMKVQPGREITLPKPPKPGETVWIAPAGLSWIAEKDGVESCPFMESDTMTKLTGDGVSRVINAPLKESGKTEYKLYVVNSAAASIESTGSIIVDETSPIVVTVPESKSFIYSGEVLKVRSNKKGKVYVLKASNIFNSVEDLEEAVRLRTANSVNITKANLEYSLPTIGLEFDYTNNSYVIVSVDEAGNLSDRIMTPITIVKDTADLEFVIDMAKRVSFTEDPLKAIQLSNAIKKAEDTLYYNKASQKEIENITYELKNTTIRLTGNSKLFQDWEDVLIAKRNIRIQGNITYSDILGYIINTTEDIANIKLPISYNSDISIEWISDSSIIDINGENATVTIPNKGEMDVVVTLTASIRKVNTDIAVKKYVMIAVKARK